MNLYILDIETYPAENQATLRLRDQQGVQRIVSTTDHRNKRIGAVVFRV